MGVFFLSVFLLFVPLPVWAHTEITTIVISSEGFTPREMTTHQGSQVNFINKDTRSHWPASDVHPTHEVYSDFDPLKPILAKEIWGFRFEKMGSWKYHDHLDPHKRGVINVVGEKVATNPFWEKLTYIKQIFQRTLTRFAGIFRRQPESSVARLDQKTFKKMIGKDQLAVLGEFARSQGTKAAWDFVVQAYSGQSGMTGGIHDLAHLVGLMLFTEKGWEGLAVCTPQFAFGCYHGFLDKAFAKSLAELKRAEESCLTLGPENSGPHASCFHGVGHGIASFYQTADLFGGLHICDQLGRGKEFCYDGVFMEFQRSASGNFYSAANLLSPCDTLESKYIYSCARNLPQVMFGRFQKTLEEVIAVCVKAKDPAIVNGCVDALGLFIANNARGNPEEIKDACGKIVNPGFNHQCLTKAAGELVFQEMLNWQVASSKLCSYLEEPAQQDCDAYVSQITRDYKRGGLDVNVKEMAKDTPVLKHWLKIVGPKGLLAKLVTDSGNGAIVDCHQEAHLLGRAAYELFGTPVFKEGNSSCHSGFYHGAMEAFLVKEGTENISVKVDSLCTQFSTAFGNFECFHGVGHGVLAYEDYDLPEALKLCQKISRKTNRESCLGGIFMENIVVAQGNGAVPAHETRWVNADPHFPCNAIDKSEEIQQQCYHMQTSRMINLFKHDYALIVRECLTVADNVKEACFQSLGRDAAGQIMTDPQKIAAICQLTPTNYFDRCIAGALNVVVDFWGENVSSQPVSLCQVLTDANRKNNCYGILVDRLPGLFGQDKDKIGYVCSFFEDSFKKSCLNLL